MEPTGRMPVPPPPPASQLSVVAKVVAIIEAIADADGLIGLSELSRRSGVPKATVHRLCRELVAWGIVERAGDAFRLGARLYDLGQRAPARRLLRDGALPAMEALWAACQHTVHLAVARDGEVFYIEKIPGAASSPTPSVVAGRVPLHCTATGKCLLAFGPPELFDDALAHGLGRLTQHTITDPNILQAAIDEIRNAGWAAEHEEFAKGFTSVAAPVLDRTGMAIAAIAATAAEGAFADDAIAPMVLRAAAEATSRVGGRNRRV